MSDFVNGSYGLLSDAQVFGEQAVDLMRTMGGRCPVTDYAILLGADVSEEHHLDTDRSGRGRTGKWFLSTAAGYGDVSIVNADGQRAVAYTNQTEGIRPVLPCNAPDQLTDQLRKDISGFTEVSYGEYPQHAADRELARELNSAYSAGTLRRTGKSYRLPQDPSETLEEYAYQDRKFIRAPYLSKREHRLSNGRTYHTDDLVWIEAAPVLWLYDADAALLISRSILAGGLRYASDNYYNGDFEHTEICRFLRASFAEDLRPSVVREMTEAEQAQYEEDMHRAEKRRNPYGLQFGQVSEEDIIRGAIESDIAVFLHGPSSEGKSARVKQIDPTCEIVYLRNATPDSLNGRSVYNQDTGEMIDIPPTWYKKVKAKCEAQPDQFHVVFFDEINNALPSIQGMAFNIVLDREVNGLWKLPDNARVVAAGNDMQDSLAANQIAAPFFNRFAHVYINTTTDKWLQWASDNHIHPAIYSFIAFRRGETLRSKYDGKKPNADPRKWEMASKMLYKTGRPEMLRALIGEEITDEFVQFCSQPVITLENVLSGNYTDSEVQALNTAERYATTMGLSQVGEDNLDMVRGFVSSLGEEFRAVFDFLWAHGDEKRQALLEKADRTSASASAEK